jgi:integrase
VVLSREEVARLIEAAGNIKYQTALSLAYGTGLRAGEVVALKVGDIDSQRMTLEQKVDIRIIQVLLGHKKLDTTALYAQVATEILHQVVSPLERRYPA